MSAVLQPKEKPRQLPSGARETGILSRCRGMVEPEGKAYALCSKSE
jgi:hypothetical protein